MKKSGLAAIGLSVLFACTAPPEPANDVAQPQAHADTVDRFDVRAGYFNKALEGRDPRHRDLPEPAMQYGQPEWSDAAQAGLDGLAPGERWALGRDFWTTLDINSGLKVGDAHLSPGKYYLVMERTDEGFDLIALESTEVRAAGLNIAEVGETTGGHRAALKHAALEGPTDKLMIQFPTADTPPGLMDLRIRFGPNEWSVDLLDDVEAAGEKDVEALGLEAPRKMARFIHDNGLVTVAYGQPEWKQEYVEQFDAFTKGKRWRFGRNWWTTLDTNVPLTLGGVAVEPGDYYLLVERPAEGDDWYLMVIDPAEVRKLQLDPVMAFETVGGQRAELNHELTESTNELMTIEIYPDDQDPGLAMLAAWWGNHRLSAPLRLSQ